MGAALQITLSFGLTFGVPALLGVRELILLRRPPDPPDWIWRPEDMRPRDPVPGPNRAPAPVRQLEDA